MAAKGTLIFRASLEPKIFREIEIAASASLHELAQAIAAAFDFDFDHAFGFYNKLTGSYSKSTVKYELFADMGESDAGSVENTAVSAAFPADKVKFLFLFDYGDQWEFKIERIGSSTKTPGANYPRVTKSTGKAPEQYPHYEE
jgi:hypothetical protein